MKNIINPFYFFLSFSLSVLTVYFLIPKPNVILKFPSPLNSGKIIYRNDKNDSCYIYEANKQDACPSNTSLIQKQPN